MTVAGGPVTMRRLIDDAAEQLAAAGVGSPRVDAELLAAHVAGTDRGLVGFTVPDTDFAQRFGALVARRAQRVPLQHLTGTAAFGPVTVHVGPGVFVPRPETEALLEWALAQPLPAEPVIVDLCTGSGALALALATARPRARVVAVDDSPDALRYARRNAEGTSVEVVSADVTSADLLTELDGAVDLLVTNPPYIPTDVWRALDPQVRDHEPELALHGGSDGLDAIRAIAQGAAAALAPAGWLLLEHHHDQSEAAVELLRQSGLNNAAAHLDLEGVKRFACAQRPT